MTLGQFRNMAIVGWKSSLGQSRRFDFVPPTSALPPSTDIVGSARQVRFVPGSRRIPSILGSDLCDSQDTTIKAPAWVASKTRPAVERVRVGT